ncbi:unnamed protein product [Rhodiola kirilowii]
MQVRRQLQDLRQGPNETMYDYLEKFNRLEQSCCNLGLPEKLILEYLLDGLKQLDKMLLDASAGGTMMSLSPRGIRELISKVAENARFRDETTRQDEFSRSKIIARAEAPVNTVPEEIKQMKEMMIQLLRRQTVQEKPCEFCGSTDHKTDACPTLIVEDPVEVNAVLGYQGYNNNRATPQPAQSFYQPPHQQYNQNAPPAGQYQQRGPNQYQAGPSNHQGPNQHQAGPSHQSLSKPIEDVVKELTSTVHRNMVKTDGAIANLTSSVHQNMVKTDEVIADLTNTVRQNMAKTDETITDLAKTMSQLANSMTTLNNETCRLPLQTSQNPKGNVNAVTLRSGRKLVIQPMEQEEEEEPKLPEENRGTAERSNNAAEEHKQGPVPATEEAKECPVPRTETSKISAALPFQVSARVPKQQVKDNEVLELFSKVEINIPLLEAIKQIPRYAKFLKELCTNRRRNTRIDQELMSRNVSASYNERCPPSVVIRELTPFHAQLATSGSRTAC